MLRHDRLRNMESDPETGETLSALIVDLKETLEYLIFVTIGDTDAEILNAHGDIAFRMRKRDDYLVRTRRIFNRVHDNVGEDPLVDGLSADKREVVKTRLSNLISVYPFNEYEYILSTLLGYGTISIEDYHQIRDEYIAKNIYLNIFQIGSPRGFGELWAQGHLKELVPELVKPTKKIEENYKGDYDFILPGQDHRFYRVLYNPFYYGWFEWPQGSGNWHKGKHEPMITREEYDKVQELLGRGSKPKPETYTFAYTGMIRCGECGCMVTAEHKTKRNKNGNVHRYIYYHCTKRKGPCKQKCIEVKELEKQVTKTLSRVKPPEEFHGWAMKWLQNENGREASDRNAILANQQKNYEVCVRKVDTLIDMRAAGEISEEEFTRKKSEINQEKVKLHELLNDTDARVDSWMQTADNVLTFAKDAKEAFTERGEHARKVILTALGSNLLLKDKKISIDTDLALLPMILVSNPVEQNSDTFEPPKRGSTKRKSAAFGDANPIWLLG